MIRIFTDWPEQLVSFIAIIVGAIVGGLFSWIITKKSTDKTIEVQNKIVEDNRRYAENIRARRSREYANIIRLDICTALFNSIRILKNINNKSYSDIYPIPMDREYSANVVYLKNQFELKELSYIYQLYGIIEKLNKDTNKFRYYNEEDCENLKIDCELFLKKIYGENMKKVLEVDIDKINYDELYNNKLIKNGYKEVLYRLDNICNLE